MRHLFYAIVASFFIYSPCFAIESGEDDENTPEANATVSLNGCSGTLISPTVVITSGHCFDDTTGVTNFWRPRPAGHVDFPHPCARNWQQPTRWYILGRPVQVRFGNDSRGWRFVAQATQYSVVGCVDVMLLRLTNPVPPTTAIPATVATRFTLGARMAEVVGWGSTNLEELYSRSASSSSPGWTRIGHANLVTGMAASDGFLFAATEGNSLWRRPASNVNSNWTRIGGAADVTAMTAYRGLLYAATSRNELWTRQANDDFATWQRIGHANNVVAMAAWNGKLFAATGDNGLWVRDAVDREQDWRRIGSARNVLSMTAVSGELYATSRENVLWKRQADETDRDWVNVDIARRVRAMTAWGGTLYGAQRRASNGSDTQSPAIIRQRAPARLRGTRDCVGLPIPAAWTGTPYRCVTVEEGASIKPGDSGGSIFSAASDGSRVLLGVTQGGRARYVATNFNANSGTAVGSGDVGRWIETMANPARPTIRRR